VGTNAVRLGMLKQIRAISLIYHTLYTDSSFQKYSSCRVILSVADPRNASGASSRSAHLKLNSFNNRGFHTGGCQQLS
jgi:hypothetical protein